jgi:uncharacterized membrane protein
MCNLVGFLIGLFFLVLGGYFLYFNTKEEPLFSKLISLYSIEGGAFALGILIILVSILETLGIVQGTCKSDFFN